MPVPTRVTVSAPTTAEPVAVRLAPLGFTELGQPLPAVPMFPHGQAVPERSPKQYAEPVEPGPQFGRRSQVPGKPDPPAEAGGYWFALRLARLIVPGVFVPKK